MIIPVTIKNKIAAPNGQRAFIVSDNSDYFIDFTFDDEWSKYDTKTARFAYGGGHTDVVFTGSRCSVPVIHNARRVTVGVYAGDLTTSTGAELPVMRSIRSFGGAPIPPTSAMYDQIMQKLNELSGTDSETVAKVVENYLTEHPLEETDPTVPEWAKEKEKPTYTAAEVGAATEDDVTSAVNSAWQQAVKQLNPMFDAKQDKGDYITLNDLQAATNAALAQAKASGEFDGADGKDGAGMDVTGATVGQIAKITAVDDNGKPTAWGAVDMPSGDGDTWEKVYDGTTEINDGVSAFEVDLTRNDTAKEFQLHLKIAANTADDWGSAKNIELSINGALLGYFIFQNRLNTYTELLVRRELEGLGIASFATTTVRMEYNKININFIVSTQYSQKGNGKFSMKFGAAYAGKITATIWGRY